METRSSTSLLFPLLVFTVLSYSCQPGERDQSSNVWIFADSSAASQWIQRDTSTAFFQQIGTADMLLQMGSHMQQPFPDRDSVLVSYRNFLGEQARTFSVAETELLDRVLQDIRRILKPLNPGLFPDTLRLAKISGKGYGPSVYYTREKGIMIPANELYAENRPGLQQVLLHELFHIYTRYHPAMCRELYQLIGFTAAQDSVFVPDSLQERLLLNPDGVRWQYKFRIGPRVFFPLLYTRTLPPAPGASFKDQMAFGFFPADSTAGGWVLEDKPEPVGQQPEFRRITGGNTDYIIHPDEILADNFVLLVLRTAGYAVDIDETGERILHALEQKLQ